MSEPKPEKLCVPAKVLDQHLVVLGKTGAGKSSALRHFVEHLLSHNKRVCIVDPKGDWWGIKTSADGKAGGFPIIAFGDFKNPKATDVPINDRSGKHVAELVATGNRPCVIGVRGWSQGGMIRFWIDFASTLFAKNAGELYLVGDEFHNFAPKQWKGQSDRETPVGVALHWSNRLLSEGRGLGIVCLIASQRPQKVHNDTLTSCETLVAMRVVHAADRAAVKLWIDGNGDPEVGKDVMATLAGMERGEGWVWSPEIGFGPKRLKFPMFTTFDSFAPPQLQRKVSESGWAGVDLDAVKQKLADVIQEEKANDPKELRAQIIKLRAELNKAQSAKPPAAPAKVETKRVEVAVLKDGQLKRAEALVEKLLVAYDKAGELEAQTKAAVDAVAEAVKKMTVSSPAPLTVPRPTTIPRPVAVATARQPSPPARRREETDGDAGENGDGSQFADVTSRDQIPKPMLRILDAYAWWHSIGVEKPSRENIAPIAGYSNIRSSGFRNPLYSCNAAGLVADDALTDRGTQLAAWPEAVTSLAAYHAKLKGVMDGPTAKLFDELHKLGGSSTRTELAGASGYSNERSSGFRNPLYRLSSMGLVELGKGETITATMLMYPAGLK